MGNLNNLDFDTLLIDAVQWAHRAAEVQLQYFRSNNIPMDVKLNESDIVTVADKASEAAIIEGIRAKYPDMAILAEESGDDNAKSDFQWVIDPLDGTTNFKSGLPQFCISIGLKHKGETIIGVVFAPYLNELYTAIRDEGAFLNGKEIHCNRNVHLERAVVSTGFPVDKGSTSDNNLDNFSRIMPLVRGVRRMGAAALDICSVAAGFLDAYWEINLHEWDVCAATLIAQESGCVCERFRPDRNVSLLVASPGIFPLISPLIAHTPPA